MRRLLKVGFVTVLALATVTGCDEEAAPRSADEDFDEDEYVEEFLDDLGQWDDLDDPEDIDDAGAGAPLPEDAGNAPPPNLADSGAQRPPVQSGAQRSEVPGELVGTWHTGSFDFVLWENYREAYWAGKSAAPTREAMVFQKNGNAKFYRYEFAFNLYEELVDCEGTVAFHGDGTFTFYPAQGRKRFNDFRYDGHDADRPLTAAELVDPELAGRRAYSYPAGSQPDTLQIKVPSSAPYNWYRAQ